MRNRDLFYRDPREYGLENHGVAKVSDRSALVLRYELETFVCTGQYADGLRRILEAYLERFGRTEQTAVWVSGFFGSGKSHLVKMLAALWANEAFDDGARARDLVAEIPASVTDHLRELDKVARSAGGALALAGTLGSNPADVPSAVARIVLEGVGLPGDVHLARFVLWLRASGHLDAVRQAIEAQGRSFEHEVENLYVSPVLHEALHEAGLSAAAAGDGDVLLAQFPAVDRLSTKEFVDLVRDALLTRGDGRGLPATLLVLDEVQQTIGDSAERGLAVQEVVEACTSRLDGRVLVVGTGQQALTATQSLQKIAGRFFVKVQLQDTDIEQVTRRVVLRKKPEHSRALEDALEAVSGEIDRHLHGTPLAARAEDRETLVADYPLLPVRRRLWEKLLQVFDAEGTTSQLRSQLGIVHAAARAVADSPVGEVVAADFLYQHFETELRNSGQVPREHLDAIAKLRGGVGDEPLMARACALVYLLGKLEQRQPTLGVRATPDVLADLLVTNLPEGSAALRGRLPALLAKLKEEGLLMEIDSAYRLQTRAGSDWVQDFGRRKSTLRSGTSGELVYAREVALKGAAAKLVASVKLTQGSSKQRRELVASYGLEPPEAAGEKVPVWVRTGWDVSEVQALDAARKLPVDSPLLVVYLPRLYADALDAALVDRIAAKATLVGKGNVSTPEEQEARAAMESRQDEAQRREQEHLDAIVAVARVWVAGGEEVVSDTPDKALLMAAERALVRLFPQFSLADDARWEKVYTLALKGNGAPLEAVGYQGEPGDQPLVRTVLDRLGNPQRGQDIRQALRASPYGWPDDAVNAALVVLVGAALVRAEHDGAPVEARGLDARRLGTAMFQREGIRMTVKMRLDLRRKLGEALGSPVNPTPAEETAAAQRFYGALKATHAAAGGDPPAPAVPDVKLLRELEGRSGLDLLSALTDAHFAALKAWRLTEQRLKARLPAFSTLERLANHSAGLPAAADAVTQTGAIRTGRHLLDDPDPVPTLRQSLATVLRRALAEALAAAESAVSAGEQRLSSSAAWQALPEPKRDELAAGARGLLSIGQVPSAEAELLALLDKTPLSTRAMLPDSIRASYDRALDEAGRLVAPKATRFTPPAALLQQKTEVDAYVADLHRALLARVEDGPVMI